MGYATTNPATGECVETFDTVSDAAVEAALEASVRAFRVLSTWSLEQRSAAMYKLAAILDDEADALGALITLEMGKTLREAVAEVRKCAAGCRFYADRAAGFMADEPIESETAARALKVYLPLGPVLAVMPWNYPFWQVCRFAAPALMAGNSCLLKHAPNVPRCAAALEDAVLQAGFPEGAFQNLYASVEQVGTMLRDDRVRAATLTGSERAGSAVGAACGEAIKPSVLELGGSDAFIVMPSADMDAAVAAAVTARTQNCGQSCIAGKRFIVHTDIYGEFRDRFKAAIAALKVGDPLNPESDIGPLASGVARDTVVDQVRRAVAQGATLLAGARSLPGPGYYFRPGILEGVTPDMDVYREEIFAPVAMLFEVDSLDAAIDLANDSPFGLGSVIFTQDPGEQRRAIRDVEAGATFVNALTASHPALPFGGIKRSGYGRELAAEGLRAFCNAKTVVVAA